MKRTLQFFLILLIQLKQWYLGMWTVEPGDSYLTNASL